MAEGRRRVRAGQIEARLNGAPHGCSVTVSCASGAPRRCVVHNRDGTPGRLPDSMNRLFAAVALCALALAVSACGSTRESGAGWTTLLDANTLGEWNRLGNANWRVADGAIQADRGEGYLVSKRTYRDFELRAEVWVDADANSGVFIRMSDPLDVTPMNSYEVNLFDTRPDPSYGTGAIVGFAKVDPMPRAAGRWNTLLVTARGPRITVDLNGHRTVSLDDSSFTSGPIALQYAAGIVRFRKVEVRPL